MSYTQSHHLTNNEISGFLERAQIAGICAHNEDGTIPAVLAWFIL
ncbi:MAG: hypothetical protein ACFFG0_08375 [Candidatus Thorarchaeota archaeon]